LTVAYDIDFSGERKREGEHTDSMFFEKSLA
jgi:hypothetical protein